MTAITLTYTGDPADLTLAPGDTLFVQSTANAAAVVPIVFTGDPAVLTLTLDTVGWGTAYTLSRTAPGGGGGRGAGGDHAGQLRAFRESTDAARRAALQREAERQRTAHDQTFWSTIRWR